MTTMLAPCRYLLAVAPRTARLKSYSRRIVSRSRSRLRRLGFFLILISRHSARDLTGLIIQDRELRDQGFRSPAGPSDSCLPESLARSRGPQWRRGRRHLFDSALFPVATVGAHGHVPLLWHLRGIPYQAKSRLERSLRARRNSVPKSLTDWPTGRLATSDSAYRTSPGPLSSPK